MHNINTEEGITYRLSPKQSVYHILKSVLICRKERMKHDTKSKSTIAQTVHFDILGNSFKPIGNTIFTS